MMSSPTSSHVRRRHPVRDDQGNVLPITLVFLTLTSLIVLALLTFSMTLFQNRPPLEERSDSLEAVRSATRMAITMQRSHGPEGCYQSTSGGFQINGRAVAVTCRVLSTLDDTGGRYGLISTSANGLASRSDNGISATGTPKTIRGSVFVNGGNLGAGTAGISMIDGDLSGAAPSASYTTSDFRYTAIPTTTAVNVGAAATCASLYGPNVVSTPFTSAEYGTTKGTVRAVAAAPAVVVTRTATTIELLGVIVHDSGGQVMINRNRATNHSFTVSGATAASTVTQIEVCSQPATPSASNYIPTAKTFCGSPLMNPELFSQPAGDTLTCEPLDWWEVAGWRANTSVPYSYPMLPQIPTYQRSSTPTRVGSSNCYVFYPGRYTGALDLNGANSYFFASGVYLFENEVLVRNGAQVVGGEGTWDGCTFDAEASFLPTSPRNHEITGKGVTFLFGSSPSGPSTHGKLRIDSASVRLNQRIATTSTRASSGISIMTVNTQSATGVDPVIPANSQVLLPGCLQSEVAANPACGEDIATYSITPITSGTPLSYNASGLTGTDLVIDANLNGNNVDTNRLMLAGAVFTPNAAVDIRRTSTSNADRYQVVLAGGVTASTMKFDFTAGDSTKFFVGEDAASVYQKVELQATTNHDDRLFVSTVQLELDDAERYAINSWTVGGDQAGPGTTTGATSSTTTTLVGTPAPDPWLTVVGNSNPIAHWRLGESGAATVAVDRIAGFNGTYSGSPTPSLGVLPLIGGDSDTAAGFSGGNSSSRVAIPSNSTINSSSVPARTIELFFRADTTDSRQVLFEEGGTSNGFNVYISGSTLYTHAWSSDWDNFLLASTPISTNQTYHVVAALDAVTARSLTLYVNGVAVSTVTKPDANALRPHSDAIGIGARNVGTKFHDGNSSGSEQNEFTGIIDEVVLYNTALDAATVTTHYVSATTPPAPTPTTSTTTSTTTTSTTTTSTTTTTTTTTLPPGYDYCGSLPTSGWTFGTWGPGDWTVQHWTNRDFTGSPAASGTAPTVDVNFANGSNTAINRSDDFAIRWTRVIDVQSSCSVRFRLGGDDGFRLMIDGSTVFSQWRDQAYTTSEVDYTLTPGQHTVVYEFYERGGYARATLEWRRN